MIESVNNERVIKYSKLNNKKYRDQEGLFIVEGDHLVEEASKYAEVVEIFTTGDYANATKVSVPVMKKISGLDNPPKVLAIVKKLEEKSINGNVIILDDIQDPGNLGTIIRSAVAFNIDTIILSNNSVDLYNTKTIRASEGMIFKVNIIRTDLESIINKLKDNYDIITTDVVSGIELSELKVNAPYAIIMGNEGNGVSENISKLANKRLNIKMNKACESLNVGVATSIILYELNK